MLVLVLNLKNLVRMKYMEDLHGDLVLKAFSTWFLVSFFIFYLKNPGTISGPDGSRQPSELELEAAETQGI